MNYKTIKDKNMAEIIEKKSKFIAQVFYIDSKKEAEKIISEVEKKYYDARHNCYAYSVYDENKNEIYTKSSDDGEPSGTAGLPMLSVINGNNLVNVLLVVTRYFGGILLGTGGLVRAYKEATEKVIEHSKLYNFINGYEIKISLDYNSWDKFLYYSKNKGINIIKTEYYEKIQCLFEISSDNFEEDNPYYSKGDIIRQKAIISEF